MGKKKFFNFSLKKFKPMLIRWNMVLGKATIILPGALFSPEKFYHARLFAFFWFVTNKDLSVIMIIRWTCSKFDTKSRGICVNKNTLLIWRYKITHVFNNKVRMKKIRKWIFDQMWSYLHRESWYLCRCPRHSILHLAFCMLGNFLCLLPFFQNYHLRNTFRMSNRLDPDQDRLCWSWS